MSSSRERRYLHNQDHADLYNGFSVEKHAVRVIAAGLTAPIQVQVLAGDNPEKTADWAPLTNGPGNFVQVAPDNTDLMFMKVGRYRLDPASLAAQTDAVIWVQDVTHASLDELDYQYTVSETYAAGRLSGLGAAFLNGQYVHLPTGLPVWTVASYSANGQVQHTYYYIDSNGDTVMANQQSVGANTAPTVTQFVGNHKFELFDSTQDIKIGYQDMLDRMAAAGVQLYDPMSNAQVVDNKADMLVKIDIDLKPIAGGAGELDETNGRATTAEAAVYMGGGDVQNMDGGGSRTFGDLKNGAFYVKTNFDTLIVKQGSVVEVTVVAATIPA